VAGNDCVVLDSLQCDPLKSVALCGVADNVHAPAACSGKINLEYLGSTSDEYVFGNRIIETVVPQSGAAATAQQATQ
jgi:hypothetical protein